MIGLGMVTSALGGIANIIGAVGQKKEAQRQLEAQNSFGINQRYALKTGYEDILSKAKGMPTYQKDLTRYTKAEQFAQTGLAQAQAGRVAGEDLAREQVRQTTANTLAAAERGAGSAADLLTATLFAQGQENEQMRNITQSSMQTRQQMQQQANQNMLATLGQTAAAEAQQRGLEFESEYQKQANILGLTKEQMSQSMGLEQDLFNQQQAKAAAVANANAAIWSGIGGLASSIGGGMMNIGMANKQMDTLQKIYNPQMQQMDGMNKTIASNQNPIGNFFNQGWMGKVTTNLAPIIPNVLTNRNAQQAYDDTHYYNPVNKEWLPK